MIWGSHSWKEDLARLAGNLRKKAQQRRWPERSTAKLEKEVFMGFYAIRKLLEAKKLSESEINRLILATVVAYRIRPTRLLSYAKRAKHCAADSDYVVNQSLLPQLRAL